MNLMDLGLFEINLKLLQLEWGNVYFWFTPVDEVAYFQTTQVIHLLCTLW